MKWVFDWDVEQEKNRMCELKGKLHVWKRKEEAKLRKKGRKSEQLEEKIYWWEIERLLAGKQ